MRKKNEIGTSGGAARSVAASAGVALVAKERAVGVGGYDAAAAQLFGSLFHGGRDDLGRGRRRKRRAYLVVARRRRAQEFIQNSSADGVVVVFVVAAVAVVGRAEVDAAEEYFGVEAVDEKRELRAQRGTVMCTVQ